MGSLDLGKLMGGGPTSEDCLFLDVYVPGKALKGDVKLPIINYIYGGAYVVIFSYSMTELMWIDIFLVPKMVSMMALGL